MKQLIKISFAILAFMIMSNKGYSQLSVSLYANYDSNIGLGYDFSDKVWTEVRLGVKDSYVPIEVMIFKNFIKKEHYTFYVGAGLGDSNSFLLPVGLNITPFEKLDKLSFHIEVKPTLVGFGDEFSLRDSWGIRYHLWK